MANLGGDENETLSTLKRDQLGIYLRDRGIPISTRNKDDRLTLAKNAEKKLLPLKTTIESDQITVLEHRHSCTLCDIRYFIKIKYFPF